MFFDRNCILTAADDYQPYWMVDLDRDYTIISMELIGREKSTREKGEEGQTRSQNVSHVQCLATRAQPRVASVD